jgi:hypothetical protein
MACLRIQNTTSDVLCFTSLFGATLLEFIPEMSIYLLIYGLFTENVSI